MAKRRKSSDSSKPLEPLILIEDEPVRGLAVDHLTLEPFARVVAGAASGTGGPFTIGVFADWGEGKTSLLRLSKELVETHCPEVIAVWFNAWQYENEPHPIVPLVASIIREVDRHAEKQQKWKELLLDLGRALRSIAYGFSLNAEVELPGFGKIGTEFVAREMIDRFDKLKASGDPLIDRTLYFNAFDALEKVADRMAKAMGDDPNAARPKVIVFVDDLDRCLPPRILKLLESIKLVLAQRGFIFVLAVDRRILDNFLARRYRKSFGMKDYTTSGKSYLDKIVQLPLYIPPHRARFEAYIETLLDEHVALQAEANAEVRKALKPLAKVLALGSSHNPRSLVRFINNLIVDRSIWVAMEGGVDTDLMGMCAVSRMLHEHLGVASHRLLSSSHTLCEELAKQGASPDALEMIRMVIIHNGNPHDAMSTTRPDLQRLDELLGQIEQMAFVQELLESELGKQWLTKPDIRKKVHEFLAEQREKAAEIIVDQRELIDEAIAQSLGKDRKTLTDQDRHAVTYLDLRFSPVTDAGISYIKSLASLTDLFLGDTSVTDAGLLHLKPLSSLKVLDLGNTSVKDAGLMHLKSLTSLTSLDLGNTAVTDAGMLHLKSLTSLTNLDLWNLSVTDAGLRHLSSLTSLTNLNLWNTSVTDKGLPHLESLFSLTSLKLDNTSITDDGLLHLKSLTKLTELALGQTLITDAGLSHLKSLVSLMFLGLDDTSVTDDGLLCLKSLTSLVELNLMDTYVTDAGVEALQAALPECKIVCSA